MNKENKSTRDWLVEITALYVILAVAVLIFKMIYNFSVPSMFGLPNIGYAEAFNFVLGVRLLVHLVTFETNE